MGCGARRRCQQRPRRRAIHEEPLHCQPPSLGTGPVPSHSPGLMSPGPSLGIDVPSLGIDVPGRSRAGPEARDWRSSGPRLGTYMLYVPRLGPGEWLGTGPVPRLGGWQCAKVLKESKPAWAHAGPLRVLPFAPFRQLLPFCSDSRHMPAFTVLLRKRPTFTIPPPYDLSYLVRYL